ncbi:filaggrin member 2 [Thelotrema lepadinum]|nr:filaggrin member 2 [Thelotrema lepadinum]
MGSLMRSGSAEQIHEWRIHPGRTRVLLSVPVGASVKSRYTVTGDSGTTVSVTTTTKTRGSRRRSRQSGGQLQDPGREKGGSRQGILTEEHMPGRKEPERLKQDLSQKQSAVPELRGVSKDHKSNREQGGSRKDTHSQEYISGRKEVEKPKQDSSQNHHKSNQEQGGSRQDTIPEEYISGRKQVEGPKQGLIQSHHKSNREQSGNRQNVLAEWLMSGPEGLKKPKQYFRQKQSDSPKLFGTSKDHKPNREQGGVREQSIKQQGGSGGKEVGSSRLDGSSKSHGDQKKEGGNFKFDGSSKSHRAQEKGDGSSRLDSSSKSHKDQEKEGGNSRFESSSKPHGDQEKEGGSSRLDGGIKLHKDQEKDGGIKSQGLNSKELHLRKGSKDSPKSQVGKGSSSRSQSSGASKLHIPGSGKGMFNWQIGPDGISITVKRKHGLDRLDPARIPHSALPWHGLIPTKDKRWIKMLHTAPSKQEISALPPQKPPTNIPPVQRFSPPPRSQQPPFSRLMLEQHQAFNQKNDDMNEITEVHRPKSPSQQQKKQEHHSQGEHSQKHSRRSLISTHQKEKSYEDQDHQIHCTPCLDSNLRSESHVARELSRRSGPSSPKDGSRNQGSPTRQHNDLAKQMHEAQQRVLRDMHMEAQIFQTQKSGSSPASSLLRKAHSSKEDSIGIQRQLKNHANAIDQINAKFQKIQAQKDVALSGGLAQMIHQLDIHIHELKQIEDGIVKHQAGGSKTQLSGQSTPHTHDRHQDRHHDGKLGQIDPQIHKLPTSKQFFGNTHSSPDSQILETMQRQRQLDIHTAGIKEIDARLRRHQDQKSPISPDKLARMSHQLDDHILELNNHIQRLQDPKSIESRKQIIWKDRSVFKKSTRLLPIKRTRKEKELEYHLAYIEKIDSTPRNARLPSSAAQSPYFLRSPPDRQPVQSPEAWKRDLKQTSKLQGDRIEGSLRRRSQPPGYKHLQGQDVGYRRQVLALTQEGIDHVDSHDDLDPHRLDFTESLPKDDEDNRTHYRRSRKESKASSEPSKRVSGKYSNPVLIEKQLDHLDTNLQRVTLQNHIDHVNAAKMLPQMAKVQTTAPKIGQKGQQAPRPFKGLRRNGLNREGIVESQITKAIKATGNIAKAILERGRQRRIGRGRQQQKGKENRKASESSKSSSNT